jgi:hypothetical protein
MPRRFSTDVSVVAGATTASERASEITVLESASIRATELFHLESVRTTGKPVGDCSYEQTAHTHTHTHTQSPATNRRLANASAVPVGVRSAYDRIALLQFNRTHAGNIPSSLAASFISLPSAVLRRTLQAALRRRRRLVAGQPNGRTSGVFFAADHLDRVSLTRARAPLARSAAARRRRPVPGPHPDARRPGERRQRDEIPRCHREPTRAPRRPLAENIMNRTRYQRRSGQAERFLHPGLCPSATLILRSLSPATDAPPPPPQGRRQ